MTNQTRTAWIGGLPQHVEEEDVKRIVENSGDHLPLIVSCNVRRNDRGTFAFVEFEEERGVEAVIGALDQTMYTGVRI